MSKNHYFKPNMPKGYRIFFDTFDVALAKEYVHEIERLVGTKDVTLQLEAQPTNKHDPNAILVTGRKKGLLWSSTLVLGYLPKEIAKEVNEKKLTNILIPRPKEIWEGDRGGFKFTVDLVGTTAAHKEFDSEKQLEAAKNTQKEAAQPATALQKEYYRFFGIKFPKGTTMGEAEEFIRKHRDLMTRADDKRLLYWDGFESLWDLLCDPDVRREDLDIKKPSLSLARKAFAEWIKEDDFCIDDLEAEEEFVDRLLELNPDLQR